MRAIASRGPAWRASSRGTAVFLALLTIAIGLCLFDSDAHDPTGHAGALDLCLGLLAAALVAPSLGCVLAVGRITDIAPAPVHRFSRTIPDPPPRLLSVG